MEMNKIYGGDCLETMRTWPDGFIDCCVTSPPYWGLRDYGCDGQLGLECTPEEYVSNMVKVFAEVKRVLKPEGTLWLNLGDSYAGSGKGQTPDGACDPKVNKTKGMKIDVSSFKSGLKSKDLCGIPWMVAFALRQDGWYLRQDIIWHKPNPMPESVKDRCTKAHEYIFLMSKKAKYYCDMEAIKEPANSTGVFRGSNGDKSGADGDRNDGGRSNIGEDDGTRNKRSV